MANEINRRDFVKQTVVGTAILASTAGALEAAAAAVPVDPNKQIMSALGPVFIPSKPGDPGYKELEVSRHNRIRHEGISGCRYARSI